MTEKRISDHIRESLERKLFPKTFKEIEQSQWSARFEQLMRNRMIMGAYRYGLMDDPSLPKYDNVGSAMERLGMYLETGNTEHLVDAANLCMVEFLRGCCVEKQIWAPSDDGYHTKELP